MYLSKHTSTVPIGRLSDCVSLSSCMCPGIYNVTGTKQAYSGWGPPTKCASPMIMCRSWEEVRRQWCSPESMASVAYFVIEGLVALWRCGWRWASIRWWRCSPRRREWMISHTSTNGTKLIRGWRWILQILFSTIPHYNYWLLRRAAGPQAVVQVTTRTSQLQYAM